MTTENNLIGKIEHFGGVKHCKILTDTNRKTPIIDILCRDLQLN